MLLNPPSEGGDVVVKHVDHPVGGDEGAADRGIGGDVGYPGGQQPPIGHGVGHETGADDRVVRFVDEPPGWGDGQRGSTPGQNVGLGL